MLRLCYGFRYCSGVRSRSVPPSQRPFAPSSSFSAERSRSIRPMGVVAAMLSTFLAVPVLMSGGAEGSAEILAANVTLPTATSSTSSPASTSSSLFDGSDSASLFQAGAQVEVPIGENVTGLDAFNAEDSPLAIDRIRAQPTTTTPQTSVVPTTAVSTTSQPQATTTTAQKATTTPTTAPPATSAPTTVAPTTAAPTTAAPTTIAPVTTAPPITTAPPTTAAQTSPTPEQWASLRHCESSGNYSIVSSNGLYHGAYQFGIPTWNGVAAASGRPDLVGVKPSAAAPVDQDALALALWLSRGPSPWPVCGRYLPPLP